MTVFREKDDSLTSKKKVFWEKDDSLTSKKKVYDEGDWITEVPMGWRFLPTEKELVESYLWRKVALRPLPAKIIKEIDAHEFYSHHPKKLVNESCLPCSEMEPEPECYLFIHNDEYFHGCIKRTKPVGEDIGYWRCNGKEEAIFDVDGNVFAYKVHYTFFADGKKTHWKMEEYRLLNNRRTINDHDNDHDQKLPRDEWVVAKIRGA